jgi:5'-nucleotidase
MADRRKILLVNDDGVEAPGLWTLYERIQSIAEPVIVAPMREQSGQSHAVTVRHPMELSTIVRSGRRVGYQLDGMPADCVKLALSKLYRNQISLVISGINPGSNAGHSVLYSGTVAAALEAVMYKHPAMAISLRDEQHKPTHFETAARVARRLALDILANGLPQGVALNVNVPDMPLREIDGVLLTRQGQESYVDLFETSDSPDGRVWCINLGTERVPSREGEHPLDDLALMQRCISVTPIHVELTSLPAIELLSDRIDNLHLTAERDTPTEEKSRRPERDTA